MKIDLNEIEALARAATPGLWVHRHDPGNPVGCQHGVKLPGELGAWIADCIDNADRSTDGGVAGERNAAFIAAANPTAVLELITLARQADGAKAVAIPLVSEEQALACAAQPGQQPAPVETIGKHQPFQLAVSSIRRDWTIGGVRHLTSIVDSYVAQRAARVSAPVPASSVQPTSIDGQSEFSRTILYTIYLACQRGDSPERLHAAVMVEFDKQPDSGRDAALVEYLIRYKHCMSYNDSYFSEPAGELKRMVYAADRTPPANVAQAGELSDAGIAASVLEQAAQACDQQADGTNGPYRSACLQCANAVRELRDAAISALDRPATASNLETPP